MSMGGGPIDPTRKREGLFILTEVPLAPAERNTRAILYVKGEAVWSGPVRIGPLQVTEARRDLADRKASP